MPNLFSQKRRLEGCSNPPGEDEYSLSQLSPPILHHHCHYLSTCQPLWLEFIYIYIYQYIYHQILKWKNLKYILFLPFLKGGNWISEVLTHNKLWGLGPVLCENPCDFSFSNLNTCAQVDASGNEARVQIGDIKHNKHRLLGGNWFQEICLEKRKDRNLLRF